MAACGSLEFLTAIDPETCIGCGRCYKGMWLRGHDFEGVNEDGDIVELEDEDDDDFDRKVMAMNDILLHRLWRLRACVSKRLPNPYQGERS